MPIHLCGWLEVQDPAGAWAYIAAIPDPLGLDDGDDLIIPELNQVVLVSAGVPSGGSQLCRVDSPSLRAISRLMIEEFNGGADADAEPDSPPKLLDYRGNPLILATNERATAEANYDTTAAEAAWVLLWLADGAITPVTDQRIFTNRVTTTVTLTAGEWTNASITFTDSLPVGRYAIVGANFRSPGMVAARFVFRDIAWRPGVLCNDDVNDVQSPVMRLGGLGILGEFESTAPPTVDFLSSSADTNPTGLIDLIQVRAGPA